MNTVSKEVVPCRFCADTGYADDGMPCVCRTADRPSSAGGAIPTWQDRLGKSFNADEARYDPHHKAMQGEIADLRAALATPVAAIPAAAWNRRAQPVAAIPEAGQSQCYPVPSRQDLEAIDRAMQHMGDQINESDSVEDSDCEIVTPGFEAIARLIASDLDGTAYPEVVAAQERPEAGQSVPKLTDDQRREALRDALSAALGDAMDCTRVWSAWGVGTMGERDFQLLADNDERLEELVDAVLATMSADANVAAGGKA